MADPQPTSGWSAPHPRPQRFTGPPITASATWKLPAAPAPPDANADISAQDRLRWAQDINQALGQLPDRQLTAVRLVYSHGLPISEAAAWLRTTAAETSRLVADALQHLAAVLYPPSPHAEPDIPSYPEPAGSHQSPI